MEYTELKVITVVDDVEKFENDVNGWCCNHGYKIMSCQITATPYNDCVYFQYTAFLGK